MLARGFAALLLVALAASAVPGALAASGRFDYECVKRCMDKLPDGGWQPVCALNRPGKDDKKATLVPNLCAWKECARDYKEGPFWYDHFPVDCTSRVGCSYLAQSDSRCQAAWEVAVKRDKGANPESNADCACAAKLPRNKRWEGGAFEPVCGRPKKNIDLRGGELKEEGKPLVVKKVKSMKACCEACKNVAACRAYTWNKKKGTCQLKDASPGESKLQYKRGVQSARLVDSAARKPSKLNQA